jgi:hypothetical protein
VKQTLPEREEKGGGEGEGEVREGEGSLQVREREREADLRDTEALLAGRWRPQGSTVGYFAAPSPSPSPSHCTIIVCRIRKLETDIEHEERVTAEVAACALHCHSTLP